MKKERRKSVAGESEREKNVRNLLSENVPAALSLLVSSVFMHYQWKTA